MSTVTTTDLGAAVQPEGSAGESFPATSVLIQEQVEIPLGISCLEDFRQWVRSDALPEQGRIDYIGGRIEVDLMVENHFYHAFPKAEIARVLSSRIHADRSGRLAIDRTRLTHLNAGVSTEPDLVFLSFEAIQEQRVRFIPAKNNDPDSFVEIEGSPDWVCEIVSDISVEKDTVRLAEDYFLSGVREYWIVDARGDALDFRVLTADQTKFADVAADAGRYQASEVFQRRYKLTRDRGPDGHWMYHLDEQQK